MNTNLSVPHDAVAAAGRAIHYTIAELSRQLKIIPEDDRGHAILAEEMHVMQNASKSLYSALPVPALPVPADLSDQNADLRSRLAMLLFHMINPPEPDCTCVNSLLCPDCSNYRELRDVIAKAKKVFKEGDKP